MRKLKTLGRSGFVLVAVWVLGTLLVNPNMRDESDVSLKLSQEILSWEAVVQPQLGKDGYAAAIQGEARELGKQALLKKAVNIEVSRRIPLNRTLREVRHQLCVHQKYKHHHELPSASVVIPFYDEPLSLLLRTVMSVLRDAALYSGDESQKYGVLKEVVLVDDGSPSGSDCNQLLEYYLKRARLPRLVWIKRLPYRLGITGARTAGAKVASGDVLVFLDAQCEVASDWLRPLLSHVQDIANAVAVPIIDMIDADTFRYNVLDDKAFSVGGFLFNGQFSWSSMPPTDQSRHQASPTTPVRSPTMVGGVFAIQRTYFWKLGGYDNMGFYGGENLEMSFRVWQCGGSIAVIPCSRVGHVLLDFHPNLRDEDKIQAINVARVAEVWMDDYKELFYLYYPQLRPEPTDPGIAIRKTLRRELKCRSFDWYLAKVYPHKFVPVRDDAAFGKFENVGEKVCLTVSRDGLRLAVTSCSPSPLLHLSVRHELRNEKRCATYDRSGATSDNGMEVIMEDCEVQQGEPWDWLESGQLKHTPSGLCLNAAARLTRCRPVSSQRWALEYSTRNGFASNGTAPTPREMFLRRLRNKWRTLYAAYIN